MIPRPPAEAPAKQKKKAAEARECRRKKEEKEKEKDKQTAARKRVSAPSEARTHGFRLSKTGNQGPFDQADLLGRHSNQLSYGGALCGT